MMDDDDLYATLGVSSSATQTEIKTAFRKIALSSHPDKVPENERSSATVHFQRAHRAYEILSDTKKRAIYDEHGISYFKAGNGGSSGFANGDPDLNDILREWFMGSGGFDSGSFNADEYFGSGFESDNMFGDYGSSSSRYTDANGRDRRGFERKNHYHKYTVSLETLFTGKHVRMTATRNVVCQSCSGAGYRRGARMRACVGCRGTGYRASIVKLPNGMVLQHQTRCTDCHGSGQTLRERDRCKKCKGERLVPAKKPIEFDISAGAASGDKITVKGSADESLDGSAGDIIFELVQEPHEIFERDGHDLRAQIDITLAEALCGISRPVLTHLDGSQVILKRKTGKIISPGQVLTVTGFGMPVKDSGSWLSKEQSRGDLLLVANIEFPKDGFLSELSEYERLSQLLPRILSRQPRRLSKEACPENFAADVTDAHKPTAAAPLHSELSNEHEKKKNEDSSMCIVQ